MRGVEEGGSEVLIDDGTGSYYLLEFQLFKVRRVDPVHYFILFHLEFTS